MGLEKLLSNEFFDSCVEVGLAGAVAGITLGAVTGLQDFVEQVNIPYLFEFYQVSLPLLSAKISYDFAQGRNFIKNHVPDFKVFKKRYIDIPYKPGFIEKSWRWALDNPLKIVAGLSLMRTSSLVTQALRQDYSIIEALKDDFTQFGIGAGVIYGGLKLLSMSSLGTMNFRDIGEYVKSMIGKNDGFANPYFKKARKEFKNNNVPEALSLIREGAQRKISDGTPFSMAVSAGVLSRSYKRNDDIASRYGLAVIFNMLGAKEAGYELTRGRTISEKLLEASFYYDIQDDMQATKIFAELDRYERNGMRTYRFEDDEFTKQTFYFKRGSLARLKSEVFFNRRLKETFDENSMFGIVDNPYLITGKNVVDEALIVSKYQSGNSLSEVNNEQVIYNAANFLGLMHGSLDFGPDLAFADVFKRNLHDRLEASSLTNAGSVFSFGFRLDYLFENLPEFSVVDLDAHANNFIHRYDGETQNGVLTKIDNENRGLSSPTFEISKLLSQELNLSLSQKCEAIDIYFNTLNFKGTFDEFYEAVLRSDIIKAVSYASFSLVEPRDARLYLENAIISADLIGADTDVKHGLANLLEYASSRILV